MRRADVRSRERTSANAQLPPSRSPATAPSSVAPSAAASTRWSTSAPRTTTTATATTTTATRSPRTSPTSSSPTTTRRSLAWPGLSRSGGTAVDPMDSRRHIPFQETTCTREWRRAIQGIFSRPAMLGTGPCRIHSLCGRCIEVFFSADVDSRACGPPVQSDELCSELPSIDGPQGSPDGCRLRSRQFGYILLQTERRGRVGQYPGLRARGRAQSSEAASGLPSAGP